LRGLAPVGYAFASAEGCSSGRGFRKGIRQHGLFFFNKAETYFILYMELNNFFVLKWSEDAFIKKKKNSGAVGLESFFFKNKF
jgi:hypothetical protein